jgi:probable F420-dependent oxidoreductase
VDPIVGLSFAAAATSRLKLGANIVPFGRSPVVLATELAQLDQLSGGRLLLSFVVGIDQPGERAALGTVGANRGALIDDIVPLLRAWWAGETVSSGDGRYSFEEVASPGRSHQQPLEIWFGGNGPAALNRIGRLGDGWLGSALTPPEAAVACQTILAAAHQADRFVDPEHFGMSLPYARTEVEAVGMRRLRGNRPPVDVGQLVPVGPDRLRTLLGAHIDSGVSKFVIRPLGPGADRGDELARLADVLLPLQT